MGFEVGAGVGFWCERWSKGSVCFGVGGVGLRVAARVVG